uniref:ubiquitin-like domain-containing protein n=1 Tax=Nocardia takedensis TaxID=259390 RepID=UPI000594B159
MSPFVRINRSRSPLLYAAIAALLMTLIVGAAMAIVNRKTVTVVVDGEKSTQTTMSRNVAGLLRAAGFYVTDRDLVRPNLAAALVDGATIVFNRAREITLTVDGTPRKVWTTGITAGEALEQLRIPDDTYVSPRRDEKLPLTGAALQVSTARSVSLL